MSHHWGYTRKNGPHTWSHVAPAAKGPHQSPVNIVTSDVRYDPCLENQPLEIYYVPENSRTLVNNGHSMQVTIDGTDSSLAAGPFHHKYQVEQFHFHWGRKNDRGSEHRVDGKVYPAELHIVHWNTKLASTFAQASMIANGLAVLGVFLKIGVKNRALQNLIELFPKISHSGDETQIPNGFDPGALLPNNWSKYWTYEGSLTTPPCYESVRFLIFQDPIEVSAEQLEAFRSLHSHRCGEEHGEDEFGGRIMDNFRPITPLNDRKVVASFR